MEGFGIIEKILVIHSIDCATKYFKFANGRREFEEEEFEKWMFSIVPKIEGRTREDSLSRVNNLCFAILRNEIVHREGKYVEITKE